MTPSHSPLVQLCPIAFAGPRNLLSQFCRSKADVSPIASPPKAASVRFPSRRTSSSSSRRCSFLSLAPLALRSPGLVHPRAGRPRAFRRSCALPFSSNYFWAGNVGLPGLGRIGGVNALLLSSSASPSAFENEDSPPTSAYVHLPFCRRRCFYCDFPILAVGERTEKTKNGIDSFMSDYVDFVCEEIAATARSRRPAENAVPLRTVYFGGGTPSLVPVPLLRKIMAELRRHFRLASDAEISMEMDPGTFDGAKLAGFLASGVTRASLGVQAFQPELLSACGRAHGLQEVYDAAEAIRASGLENWSLDLMASLPGQTLLQWEHSLAEAVALRPAHVSVYDLQIEEGTLFYRWFKPGRAPLPTDENAAELYCAASSRLREAGFEHYEVSNYARPGFQCRHNLVYWENRPYYAFGLGSTSYVHGRRFSRPRRFKEYATYVRRLSSSGPSDDSPRVSREEEVLDTVMLALRLARGLDLEELEARFGESVASSVSGRLVPFVEKGLVAAVDARGRTISSSENVDVGAENGHVSLPTENDDSALSNRGVLDCRAQICKSKVHGKVRKGRAVFMRLTDPEGFLVSNEVISSVFAALPG